MTKKNNPIPLLQAQGEPQARAAKPSAGACGAAGLPGLRHSRHRAEPAPLLTSLQKRGEDEDALGFRSACWPRPDRVGRLDQYCRGGRRVVVTS